jgi:hypothetical protein
LALRRTAPCVHDSPSFAKSSSSRLIFFYTPLDKASVEGYFFPMAERVFGDASIPAAERAARTVARYLQQCGIETFNARELRRTIGGVLRDPKIMAGACDALAQVGLIQPQFSGAGGSKGREAQNFRVHPAVHHPVPLVPIAPKGRDRTAIGANDTIGKAYGRAFPGGGAGS